MKVHKVATDPDDITRLSDAEVLTRLMKAYARQKDNERMMKLPAAATARDEVKQYYIEARQRMTAKDPVLVGGSVDG